MTLDLAIVGGTVVDGTGGPRRQADVGVRDGRVVSVGELAEPAGRTIDATGRIVCPGFIDPHTHYDAQILWDPSATPSSLHGVTTVVMGNCGFSIAPLGDEDDARYIREMLVRVEGMPLPSLEQGLDWGWRSFQSYVDRLEGNVAVNVAPMVGHSAVRRTVMGAEAVGREATPEEVEQMVALVREAVEVGALGFSTTRSFTHNDADGQPVPSRWADRDELLALCAALEPYPGTSLEFVTDGCLKGFTDDEVALMSAMSTSARRPLNWNVLTIDSARPGDYRAQLGASDYARERGGRVVALTMPVLVGMNMSFNTFCALWQIPGWGDVLERPVPERMELLRDPAVRETMLAASKDPDLGVVSRLTGWERYVVGDTYSDYNEGIKGRRIGDLAEEWGKTPFDALLDTVLADDLRTVLWPGPTDDDPESWAMRKEAWEMGDVMIGGSDAGAHLDRMAGASYTTEFLDDVLHGQELTTLENAVRHLTSVPASFYGMHDRGIVAEGKRADIVVFDPETVRSEPVEMVADLPGGASRLFSAAVGVQAVIVNGEPVVVDGEPTGALAGQVLRSGVDTTGTEL